MTDEYKKKRRAHSADFYKHIIFKKGEEKRLKNVASNQ